MASSLKMYPVRNISQGLRGKEVSSLLPDGAVPAVQNMWFLQSRAFVRNGLQPASPPTLGGRVQKFYDFYNLARTQNPIAITTTGIYVYNTGAGTWSLKQSGMTGAANVPPWLDVINGKVVIANGSLNGQANSGLLEWDGTASPFSPLTGGAPQSARFFANYGSHPIVASYTDSGGTSHPVGVAWGDLNNELAWATGDAGGFIFSDSADIFMGLVKWGDYLVLVRRYSVWLITPSPAPFFYQFDKRSDATGCVASGSIQTLPIGVVYLGDDGMLYLFNGVTSVAVGEGVWPLFRGGQIPGAYVANATSVVDIANGNYILSLPFGAGVSDNSATIVWNYLEGSFSKGTEALSGLGVISTSAVETWNILTNGWNTYGQQWTASEFASGNPVVYASQVGTSNVLQYSGTLNDVGEAIQWSIEFPMRDFGSPLLKTVPKVILLYQQIALGNLNVQIGYTDLDDRTSLTWLPAVQLDVTKSQIVAWFDDVPSIWKAAKISSSALNQNAVLTGLVYNYRERGPILGPLGASVPVPLTVTTITAVGTGLGDYTTTSLSYVNIDGTNLTATATIPSGWKAIVWAKGSWAINGPQHAQVAIFDSSTELDRAELDSIAASTFEPWACMAEVGGDGLSHTWTLQYLVQGGATLSVRNGSAASAPKLVVRLEPSS